MKICEDEVNAMTKQMNWKWLVLGSLVLAIVSAWWPVGMMRPLASVEGDAEAQDTTGGEDVATAPVDGDGGH